MQKAWFESWFDSKYYHILYQNRDREEARRFIDNLLQYLQPPAESRILDLACGKGRHSVFLAEKGYHVTGLDLSENSILEARKMESENLSFYTHDMRLLFRINYFDYIFNLFTSFGYFEKEEDHLRTLKNVSKGLKEKGTFVLDFMNSHLVKKILIPQSEINRGGIRFEIEKSLENGFITKKISFIDQGRNFKFQERVRAFEEGELRNMLSRAGLKVVSQFGNYNLDPFVKEESSRLILIAQKNA